MVLTQLVPTDLIPHCWPLLEPFIEQILKRDRRNSIEGYRARLCEGRMQIWAAIEDNKIIAVMITEIHTFDRMKVCLLVACVGTGMSDWIAAIKTVEDWARAVGCKEIEPVARQGWARALKPHGYELTHVMLTKEL